MKYFLILLSFVLAIILTISSLPHWAMWLRPQWMMIIVLFWVMMLPYQCGVFFAWSVGLLTDLIVGTPLCEHALIFAILAYLVLKFRRIILPAPALQQSFYIGVLGVIGICFQSIVSHIMGYANYAEYNLLSVFTTMIAWPCVSYFLTVFLDDQLRMTPF